MYSRVQLLILTPRIVLFSHRSIPLRIQAEYLYHLNLYAIINVPSFITMYSSIILPPGVHVLNCNALLPFYITLGNQLHMWRIKHYSHDGKFLGLSVTWRAHGSMCVTGLPPLLYSLLVHTTYIPASLYAGEDHQLLALSCGISSNLRRALSLLTTKFLHYSTIEAHFSNSFFKDVSFTYFFKVYFFLVQTLK